MKFQIFFLLLFVIVSSATFGAESLLESSEVFPPGMNGITRYRIPGIVVTHKGTILAYCEARKDSGADWGEIEIHLRRSVDGGTTWLPSQIIAHHGDRIE
jgi:sialidase-1